MLLLFTIVTGSVAAEGVESVELGMMLLQLGCRYAQGYGIARPMPSAQIQDWLAEWEDNSIWHHLGNETRGMPELYDLNVAIFSHRLWIDRVLRYLEFDENDGVPSLDGNKCQFGRWYKGIGATRYGSHPSYAFIPPKHSMLHEMARELVTVHQSGDKNTLTTTRLQEFRDLSDELIALLQKLADK